MSDAFDSEVKVMLLWSDRYRDQERKPFDIAPFFRRYLADDEEESASTFAFPNMEI